MREFFEAYPFSSARLSSAPAFPDYVEDVVLAADTLVRVPVPAGAGFVLFGADGDVRVKLGSVTTSFTLPLVSTSDGSGSEINPAARRIPATLGDGLTPASHLCLRAPLACRVSLAFYR